MTGDFRTLLKKYCLEGSILGLKYFYLYPDRVSRCYWAVTMLLNLSLACLLNSLLYRRFSEMPTQITIDNQFELVDNMPYPAITICSPNQITIGGMNQLKRNLVNGNVTLDINQLVPQLMGFVAFIDNLDFGKLQYLQDLIEKNRYTAINIMSLLPQSCRQFLKRCIFHRKQYPCEDLFSPILTNSGVCCTFNSIYYLKDIKRNEKKTNIEKYKGVQATPFNGLSVLVDYDPYNAMDDSVLSAGASKVILTDSREFPTDDAASLVRPGVETFHSISSTYTYCSDEVKQLPITSRNCYFTDEFFLPHFKEYHKTDCDISCVISEVEVRCHCTLLYVPSVSPHRACNFTSLPCIQDVRLQIHQLYQNGRCNCLRNCISRRYDSELIVGNLDSAQHIMYNPYSDIKFNKSSTLMHFYVPAAVYVKKKQETVMSLISLASSLGGVFGLFLGCSFISLIEICFYIYVAIKNYVIEHLQKGRRQRVGFIN